MRCRSGCATTAIRELPGSGRPSLRLGAPALLRRACALDHLPLATALASEATAFREILAGPGDAAVGWLLDRIAALAGTETDAVAATARRRTALTAELAKRRRDSWVPDLLDRLWRALALTGAGILRGVPAWHETLEDPRDPGRAGRPHPRAWLAVDRSPSPSAGKRMRRPAKLGEPPPGARMRWQPIETAPVNGRRVLVWAGRSVMASHGRIGGSGSPVWHDGRRILQPSHWLPLAAPA
jgi:hypothetical protein